MSYEDALQDLKAEYGNRKLLNTEEVATELGRSRQALAMLRYRRQFPIGKKVGGRYMVSIYDLAHFIGDPAPDKPANNNEQKKHVVQSPRSATSSQSKPTRRPPSLAKSLMMFRQSIDEQQSQIEFQNEVFARLERLHLTIDL